MNRNSSSLEKAAAVSDLFFHLTKDLPLAFSDCGHASSDAKQLIDETRQYWKAVARFRTVLHVLFEGHLKELVDIAQGAGMAVLANDWYGAGHQVGVLLNMI